LVTLNDPVYEEAAQALARRVIKDTAGKTSGASDADSILNTQLTYETRLVLSRDPTPKELAVLRKFYQDAVGMHDRPTVVKANLNLSETSLGKRVPAGQLEALTAVGSVLFNLDAALVR
jgi:hypothetical protein